MVDIWQISGRYGRYVWRFLRMHPKYGWVIMENPVQMDKPPYYDFWSKPWYPLATVGFDPFPHLQSKAEGSISQLLDGKW